MSAAKKPQKSNIPKAPVLARMFKGLTEGVAITEIKFAKKGLEIIHANPALSEISGFSAAELVGTRHGELHQEKGDLVNMRRWLKEFPARPTHYQEGYLKRKDGSTVFVAWTLSGLSDDQGEITHVMVSYRDMTANRRLREALVHSQRLDAVGRLAGGVAHDFNNLLSIINGYTEILHHRLGDDSTVRKELHEIHQAGQRAAGLVHQLLAFGRRQKMAPRVIELNRLVNEHIDILARLMGENRSLELALDDAAGNVFVDPTQMQQVFLNLVLNARDATKVGGRIAISTRNVTLNPQHYRRATDPKPGDYVLLTVADNGCGMSPETLKTLFEPFFTTKAEGEGTGLGLALVYGVVQQSGGHVRVASEEGHGATFKIYLPRSREPASPVRGKLAPLPVTGGRETLLIVEEDSVVCRMVEGILAADGYDVTACTSIATAEVALEKLKHAVHLVIIDPQAEQGEAAKLVRRIHRQQSGVKVLGIPNYVCDVITGLPARRQAFLRKPFALSSLLYEVRSLLDAKD
ncbi:MAG: hypothetical protein SynsKO_28550 [Synoicihabitans sp.]